MKNKSFRKSIMKAGLVTLLTFVPFTLGYETNKLKIENSLEKNTSTYNKNSLEFSLTEMTKVRNILKNIENSNINSYEDLINKSRNFSENEKFALVNSMGDLLQNEKKPNQEYPLKNVSRVRNILKNIENSNINSYEALINKSRNFSESQKVTLINTIGKSLEKNLELGKTEMSEVKTILEDIENSNINSYDNLLKRTKNLSESQKVTLINTIGKSLENYISQQGNVTFEKYLDKSFN